MGSFQFDRQPNTVAHRPLLRLLYIWYIGFFYFSTTIPLVTIDFSIFILLHFSSFKLLFFFLLHQNSLDVIHNKFNVIVKNKIKSFINNSGLSHLCSACHFFLQHTSFFVVPKAPNRHKVCIKLAISLKCNNGRNCVRRSSAEQMRNLILLFLDLRKILKLAKVFKKSSPLCLFKYHIQGGILFSVWVRKGLCILSTPAVTW